MQMQNGATVAISCTATFASQNLSLRTICDLYGTGGNALVHCKEAQNSEGYYNIINTALQYNSAITNAVCVHSQVN